MKMIDGRSLAGALICMVTGLVCLPAFAQTRASSEPAVTASQSGGGIRFVGSGPVVRTRVEILSASGEVVFDVTSKGNVFDWGLRDGNGNRLPEGSYACVITVKTLSGKISQRVGSVEISGGKAILKASRTLSAEQVSTIGPLEENALISVKETAEVPAATISTHDGTDGQLTATTGALTFRTGDILSGADTERMRISPDGRVGIGTDKPEADLDVAGTILGRKGFSFSDGSTLNVNGAGGLTVMKADGTAIPEVSGTGTTGRVAKWTDGPNGALGDSVISEVNGNIGIGNATPSSKFSVVATASAELRFDGGAGGATPVLGVISTPSSTTQGGASILGAGTGGSSFVFSDNLPFFLVRDT